MDFLLEVHTRSRLILVGKAEQKRRTRAAYIQDGVGVFSISRLRLALWVLYIIDTLALRRACEGARG